MTIYYIYGDIMKKILRGIMPAVLIFMLSMPVHAIGFNTDGEPSSSDPSFGFNSDNAEIVYKGDINFVDGFSSVIAGSRIYIPIITDAHSLENATTGDISSNKVKVSYKALKGGEYIDKVTLTGNDGVEGLDNAAFARIDISEEYPLTAAGTVEMRLVLSVKDIGYPETEIKLNFRIKNNNQTINRDSVYTVYTPTTFKVTANYGGSATFDFGDGINYTAKVTKKSSYYMNMSTKQNDEIVDMYKDIYKKKSHFEFYDFLGNTNTFASLGTLKIPLDKTKFAPKKNEKPKIYVYEIEGSTLKSLGKETVSFDSNKDILSIKTKTLSSYLLSSQPLLKEVDDSGDILQFGYAVLDENNKIVQKTAAQAGGTQASTADSAPASSSTEAVPAEVNDPAPKPAVNAETGIAPKDKNAAQTEKSVSLNLKEENKYLAYTPSKDISVGAKVINASNKASVNPSAQPAGKDDSLIFVCTLLISMAAIIIALAVKPKKKAK